MNKAEDRHETMWCAVGMSSCRAPTWCIPNGSSGAKPTRERPQEALRALLRSSAVYGDGSHAAPNRRAVVEATLVPELVKEEHSDYLLGFTENVLLTGEESRGVARVRADLALWTPSVRRRFI